MRVVGKLGTKGAKKVISARASFHVFILEGLCIISACVHFHVFITNREVKEISRWH